MSSWLLYSALSAQKSSLQFVADKVTCHLSGTAKNDGYAIGGDNDSGDADDNNYVMIVVMLMMLMITIM